MMMRPKLGYVNSPLRSASHLLNTLSSTTIANKPNLQFSSQSHSYHSGWGTHYVSAMAMPDQSPHVLSREYAVTLNTHDPLRLLRSEFHIPTKAQLKAKSLPEAGPSSLPVLTCNSYAKRGIQNQLPLTHHKMAMPQSTSAATVSVSNPK